MTLKQKKTFIRDLTKSIMAQVIVAAANMPEEWDGIEIRQLLADKFNQATHPRLLSGKRKRDYDNEVLVRNL